MRQFSLKHEPKEEIIPCERAAALKLKLEALKRQGMCYDYTLPNNSAKYRSDGDAGDQREIGGETVRNIVFLSYSLLKPCKKISLKRLYIVTVIKNAMLSAVINRSSTFFGESSIIIDII